MMNSTTVALEEVHSVKAIRQERAWQLFLLLFPRMLHRPPGDAPLFDPKFSNGLSSSTRGIDQSRGGESGLQTFKAEKVSKRRERFGHMGHQG